MRFAIPALLAVSILLALTLARLAVWLQSYFSPFGVIAAVCGALIGYAVVRLAVYFGVRNRLVVISCVFVAALLTAAAEHGFFYLDYRSHFAAKLNSDPKAQLALTLAGDSFQPATFTEFMSAEAPSKGLLWIVDALAMIAVAALVAHFVWRSLTTHLPRSPSEFLHPTS